MSTARERVEEDAEDFAARHYLDLHGHRAGAEAGFIAGRTVSAQQVEHAAESINEELVDRVDRGEMTIETDGPDPEELERTLARAAFTAAGLIVEEES